MNFDRVRYFKTIKGINYVCFFAEQLKTDHINARFQVLQIDFDTIRMML